MNPLTLPFLSLLKIIFSAFGVFFFLKLAGVLYILITISVTRTNFILPYHTASIFFILIKQYIHGRRSIDW